MGVKTEGKHGAEFLVSEAPGTLSRDSVTVTVPASTTLKPGAVLAVLSATGKYVPYDNAGSDGSETAAAVLYSELVNDTESGADATGVVINFAAEVRLSDLEWVDGMDDAGKLAAYVDLRTKGVKAR
jgi:hypothetical protein